MKAYSLILAGGGGTRFWPLSRNSMPKQLLNLSGNDIMINETIKRCNSLIHYEDTFIVVNKVQYDSMCEMLIPEVPRENVLPEPAARNTAPCILYAALTVLERCGDGILCIFPSDHYITEPEAYIRILEEGISLAQTKDTIVTIGVKPSYPATGYGYIKASTQSVSDNGSNIDCFVEKPSFEKASEYIKSGNYFWNAGVFICKASVLIGLFERFLPRIYQKLLKITGGLPENERQVVINEIYPMLDNISIDYGIMERVNDAVVVTGDFGWNDVGSWDALGALFPMDDNGNIVKSEYIGIDTKGCIVYGNKGKLIATVGIDDVIVVDTDDALLVCSKSKAQDVKKVVDTLKERKMTELL